jgi:lipopolysaccharide export system permease protein
MRIINRYICREFLKFFSAGLIACVALYVLAELFDRIDEFIERRVFWYDAGRYLASRLPSMIYQLTPVAFLLASVLTFSTFNRHHEITAMRASGIPPHRLVRPLLLIGVLGCLALLAAQEYVVPYANQATRVIWRTRIRHDKIPTYLGRYKTGAIWYRAGNRIWHAQFSNPLEQRLHGVVIFSLDEAGRIRQRYDAVEATGEDGGWRLRHGTLRRFKADGSFDGKAEHFQEQHLAFPERFADVSALQTLPDEMSLQDILAYAHQLDRQGLQGAPYRTEFHGRFAFSAACILMAGFGLPLAVRLNRSGGMTRAVGLTVCCGFGYWVLHAFVMALGYNGQLSPILAAWSANFCFVVVTLIVTLYVSYRMQ